MIDRGDTPGRRNELLKQELTEYEQLHREDTLWVQRVTLLIYVAAVVSGGVLVVGYAATSRWVHAAVCVLLVGMGVLAEEAPVIPLLWVTQLDCMPASLENYRPNPTQSGDTWNANEWRFREVAR